MQHKPANVKKLIFSVQCCVTTYGKWWHNHKTPQLEDKLYHCFIFQDKHPKHIWALTWTCGPWSLRWWWGLESGWGWRPGQTKGNPCCPGTERTLGPAGSRCFWWLRSWPSDWMFSCPPSSDTEPITFNINVDQRVSQAQTHTETLNNWNQLIRITQKSHKSSNKHGKLTHKSLTNKKKNLK